MLVCGRCGASVDTLSAVVKHAYCINKPQEIVVVENTSTNKPMPKLPKLEEVYTSVQCGPYCDLSYRERHVLEACYEFICRQLSA